MALEKRLHACVTAVQAGAQPDREAGEHWCTAVAGRKQRQDRPTCSARRPQQRSTRVVFQRSSANDAEELCTPQQQHLLVHPCLALHCANWPHR